MKTLLLVRHAKTESPYSLKRDYDRCLTDSGKSDATRMGKWLRSQPIQVDRVISSPAERTRHTTQLICRELELSDDVIEFREELYHASPEVFIQVIRLIPDETQTVLLVSHNDGITQFANQLTKARIDHMQPGSVFAVNLADDEWSKIKTGEQSFLFYKVPER